MTPETHLCEMCKHCDHFIDDNVFDSRETVNNDDGISVTITTKNNNHYIEARYVHCENGDQEFDHDATPSGNVKTLGQWRIDRPDLFIKHDDGNIGPNSQYHSQRGKTISETI